MLSLLLNRALAFNGIAMVSWGLNLFFRYDRVIAKIEGKKTAATKTKADVMIWRICGLWVIFAGGSCLFVTDYAYFFALTDAVTATAGLDVIRRPLAWLSVAIHAVEVGVKYEALGPSGVWKGASGNIVLALVMLVGLCLG
jgi:hypothetical protein